MRPISTIIAVGLILATSLSGAGTQQDLNILLKELETLPEADRPAALVEIAEALYPQSPRQALLRALEALRLGQLHHKAWEPVQARLIAAECHISLAEFPEALEHLGQNKGALKALRATPLALLHKEKFLDFQGRNLYLTGAAHHDNQQYASALPLLLESLRIYKKLEKPTDLARLQNTIGLSYLLLADYDKALTYAIDSLKEARNADDKKMTAKSAYLAGYINREVENYPQALESFQEALHYARQAQDLQYMAMSLNEIANIQTLQKKFSEAQAKRDEALRIATQSKNDYNISFCLHDQGFMYLEMNRLDDALSFFQRAMELDKKLGRGREIAITSISIASIYVKKSDYRLALRYLEEALPLVREAGLQKEMLEIYRLFHEAYRGLGQPARALQYLRQAYELREKLFNEEKTKQLAETQTRYESEKKQKENEVLKRDNKIQALALSQQNNVRNFLLALSAMAVLLAIALFNRYRIKTRAHRKLEQANRQIQDKQLQLTVAYRRMEELAREDPLTGLVNRRELLSRFEQEKTRTSRSGHPFILIMSDIDNFKSYNDTYGHDCGDMILKILASTLRHEIRQQDVVGRWGGDEFLFLLPETDLKGGKIVLQKIRSRIAQTFFPCKGRDLTLHLSMGASVFEKDMEFDDCLKRADQAMFREKKKRKAANNHPSVKR